MRSKRPSLILAKEHYLVEKEGLEKAIFVQNILQFSSFLIPLTYLQISHDSFRSYDCIVTQKISDPNLTLLFSLSKDLNLFLRPCYFFGNVFRHSVQNLNLS